MKLRPWPASLLGRNALLVVAVVLVAQVASALLLREMVLKPRLDQLAAGSVRNVQALREGLAALPPQARADFVAAYNRRAAQERDEGEEAPARQRSFLTPLERRFMRAVAGELKAAGGEVVWRRQEGGRLELRVALDGQDHWVLLPGLPLRREFSGAWLIATGCAALLALAGALWLQARLNRPLRQLERASRALGEGREPPPLPEDGPREIATVNAGFNRMVRGLSQAAQERALMLAGISHDLRTPLAKLRIGVEIVAPGADAQIAASMNRSIEEMDAIVGQFLDFARDERQEPAAPLDLHALAQEVQRAFADHGQAITLEGAPLPAAPLRKEALRRAMTNLLENALRHGRAPVVLATGSNDGSVWFEVRDGGEGIDAAQAEALKQPFRRAGSARSGAAGAGLGLAIVERIARHHGGALALSRAPEGGLRARVTLSIS